MQVPARSRVSSSSLFKARLIESCGDYDYIIFNEDLKRTVNEVTAIIVSSRCHKSQRLAKVEKTFGISTTWYPLLRFISSFVQIVDVEPSPQPDRCIP